MSSTRSTQTAATCKSEESSLISLTVSLCGPFCTRRTSRWLMRGDSNAAAAAAAAAVSQYILLVALYVGPAVDIQLTFTSFWLTQLRSFSVSYAVYTILNTDSVLITPAARPAGRSEPVTVSSSISAPLNDMSSRR